jgi:hypothetical protein
MEFIELQYQKTIITGFHRLLTTNETIEFYIDLTIFIN